MPSQCPAIRGATVMYCQTHAQPSCLLGEEPGNNLEKLADSGVWWRQLISCRQIRSQPQTPHAMNTAHVLIAG